MVFIYYDYTQDDFKSATEVNVEQLQTIIQNLNLVSSEFSSIIYDFVDPTFSVSVLFIDDALSGGDETILTETINDYVYEAPKTDTICYVREIQSIGTNGGTFTAGSWTTRILNTLIGNVSFATLAANQITLQAGSYLVNARAPACDILNHQIRLQNITDAETQETGSSAYSTGGVMTYSDLNISFTIVAEKIFELQHICYQTSNNIGLGKSTGWADETYSNIIIQYIQ